MSTKHFAKPKLTVYPSIGEIICSSMIAPDAPNKPAGAQERGIRRSVWD